MQGVTTQPADAHEERASRIKAGTTRRRKESGLCTVFNVVGQQHGKQREGGHPRGCHSPAPQALAVGSAGAATRGRTRSGLQRPRNVCAQRVGPTLGGRYHGRPQKKRPPQGVQR